ncbi:hypothetical protein STENM223S_04835 [Streptomyces tendae]
MQAHAGDWLAEHGRVVGEHDRVAEIRSAGDGPQQHYPYRVRFADGHERRDARPAPTARPAHRGAAGPAAAVGRRPEEEGRRRVQRARLSSWVSAGRVAGCAWWSATSRVMAPTGSAATCLAEK